MLKKHFVLLGIVLSLAFLIVSTFFYPGGSQHDETAVGFHWQHNYLSNLLNEKAVNGMDNAARLWAVAGVLCLTIAVAVFFIRFSKKIPNRGSSGVIRYAGAGAMFFAVFTATPWHDPAVTLSGTLLMLTLFYLTVFVFRSRLHWFKILCVLCLATLYFSSYIYYTRMFLEWLPIAQKVSLLLNVLLIIGLEYWAEAEDFGQVRVKSAG